MALPKLATDKERYALLHVVKKQGIQSKKSMLPPTHPNPSLIPTYAPDSLATRRSAGSTAAALAFGEPAPGEQLLPHARPVPAPATPRVCRSGRPDTPCCTAMPAKPSPLPCDRGTPCDPKPLPRHATAPQLPPLHPELPPPCPLLCSLRPRAPPFLHPPILVRTPFTPSPATLASEVPYLPHCMG